MNVKINNTRYFSQLSTACKINPCICGHNAIYQKSPCGGLQIACTHCNNRSYECAPDMTPSSIERLRVGWNEQLLNLPWSKNLMERQGATSGSIVIIRSSDAVIINVTDNMDEALAFIKNECERDFSIDYDLCQLMNRYPAHITNSRILAKVGGWPGFDISLMQEIVD